jgi:hypothetical protein
MNPVADAAHQPSTGPELRAQRLGSALRNLAADLVDELRKVARLRPRDRRNPETVSATMARDHSTQVSPTSDG